MFKNILTSVATSAVVAFLVVALVGGNQSVPSAHVSGVTNYDTVKASGLLVGTTTNSTNLSFVGEGACTLGTLGPTNINSSLAATTTAVYDAAFSGTNAGDTVIAFIATSTVEGAQGWSIDFAKPSTTPGYVEIGLSNNTGAAIAPSSVAVGSSTNCLILRSQTSNQGI